MKKKVYVKFATPVSWRFISTLSLGDVTYLTFGGSEKVHGFYCYPHDQPKCTAMLKAASIQHSHAEVP